MDSAYELLDEPPPLPDYLALRERSGLSPRRADQAGPVLANSWAWFHVRERATGAVVAMGRALGDGGWYFHIADMATLPEHQGRGLGRAVLTALLDRIRDRAPADAYITLLADEPARPLYRKLGFVETAPRSIGMRLAGDRPGAGTGSDRG